MHDVAVGVAIVLGSGLGDFANSHRRRRHVSVRRAAALARVEGRRPRGQARRRHDSGETHRRACRPISHAYEGHDMRTVTFAIRALGVLGVRTLILTNAAGGVNTSFAAGALMVIDDHINLMGGNPLVGANDDRFGSRFPDIVRGVLASTAWDCRRGGPRDIDAPPRHGIYAALARSELRKRRPKSATCGRSAPTPWACPPCRKRLSRATWASPCWASRASATWPPVCCRSRWITTR